MKPAIESPVARPEATHADELSGLDEITLENIFGDRFIKDVKNGLRLPLRNNGELSRHAGPAAALSIRMARECFALRFVFVNS